MIKINLMCYIAPDIQYCIDSLMEFKTLPPDVYAWLIWFNEDTNGLIDSYDNSRETLDQTISGQAIWLEEKYIEWQKTAPVEHVAFCLAYAVFNRPKNIRHELRELVGQLAIPESSFVRDMPRAIKKNGIHIYNPYDELKRNERYFSFWDRIERQWNEFEHKDMIREFKITHEYKRSTQTPSQVQIPVPKKTEIKKETKKALKRSAKLFETYAGDGSTGLFLSGEEIRITGKKYIFVLKKTSSVTMSHGACSTTVLDATTGNFIAKICVYSPNVTVFDHMVSIIFHCKAGMEDLIIKESNVMTCADYSKLPEEKRVVITQRQTDRNLIEQKAEKLHNRMFEKLFKKNATRFVRKFDRVNELDITMTNLFGNQEQLVYPDYQDLLENVRLNLIEVDYED